MVKKTPVLEMHTAQTGREILIENMTLELVLEG